MNQRQLRPTSQVRRRHSGAVTLELIIALPALVIAILAIVETGILMANLQTVAAASRDGGRLAARTRFINSGTTASIRNAVNRRLQNAGLGNACIGVTLQHNVRGRLESYTTGACSRPTAPALPSRSVRVRVCVSYERLAPNLLRSFGLSLAGRVAEKDATFSYEL